MVGLGCGVEILELSSDDSFVIQYYWRVIFAIPIGISLFQIILLLTVFPYETPLVLKERKQIRELRELMDRIYTDSEIVD